MNISFSINFTIRINFRLVSCHWNRSLKTFTYLTRNFQPQEIPRKIDISHGKSLSAVDADSAYKTVDFLKTEAFNITRQDAEASRNNHH